MIQIHLDIQDQEYQRALGQALIWQNNWQREICLHTFTGPEERRRFWQSQDLDRTIWLISEEYKRDGFDPQGNILWMTQEPTCGGNRCFLYQALAYIQKQIIDLAYTSGLVENPVAHEQTCQFYYLYSPFGGIGVSTTAYQVAKEIAKKERVLLVSLDAYQVYKEDLISLGLSDLLFYWQTLNRVRVEDFCQQDGNLDILYGPKNPEDLMILRSKTKKDFCQLLAQAGYTKLIFDLSASNMALWWRPEEKNEHFIVLKALGPKWLQFCQAVDFDYRALAVENALTEIQKMIRG